jgi:hypothetical protein
MKTQKEAKMGKLEEKGTVTIESVNGDQVPLEGS